MSIEEPEFSLVRREGAFEVRDYGPTLVAEVTVIGSQHDAARKGFRMLAGYIFGGNRERGRLTMTAPVVLSRRGQMIAMTAPVSQTPHDDAWVVRFTLPRGLSLDTLPQPNNPEVRLSDVEPARVTVLKFSGRADAGVLRARAVELEAFVRAQGLRPLGPVSLAQYDPPWVLGFMRRNEVMIPVAT